MARALNRDARAFVVSARVGSVLVFMVTDGSTSFEVASRMVAERVVTAHNTINQLG